MSIGRAKPGSGSSFTTYLAGYVSPEGEATHIDDVISSNAVIPRFVNEFWTAKQRQASSIHEISYRACFKPQLPRFFIELLTRNGEIVYDPFSGRGTTIIEAGLLDRHVIANDANPLSRIMTEPRFSPPDIDSVRKRLGTIPREGGEAEIDLSMFYCRETEQEIVALKEYIKQKRQSSRDDRIDRWIAMVATNRLTGHSPGFFSVYTLPPNQAVSQASQSRINKKRGQLPEYRDTHRIILMKTKSLLRSLSLPERKNLSRARNSARLLAGDARFTPEIPDNSVTLTVTSPPFLDIVKYRDDNWLRCWFNGLDGEMIGKKITLSRTVADWAMVMGSVFEELFRVTRAGGWVAFEVGEIRKRSIRLEEHVVPLGIAAGFVCECILINHQTFTKTSNIWGVNNMVSGTNSNRIVLFRKPGLEP